MSSKFPALPLKKDGTISYIREGLNYLVSRNRPVVAFSDCTKRIASEKISDSEIQDNPGQY